MRKIAIYDSFTEPKHRRLIDETAARAGFTVDYYAAPAAVPADKRGDYEVIYGMPKPGELKDFVNLKWFCGSFAGVDAYLDDSLYPSPEVMLSNSSGAYGVTIAEHMVMVTLMLLRHAPAYCADQAAGRWGRVLPMRSIMGSTITIVGTGDIGTEFARRAKAMVAKMDELGFGNCTNTGACQAECPKSISIAHIARLNRDFIIAKLKD